MTQGGSPLTFVGKFCGNEVNAVPYDLLGIVPLQFLKRICCREMSANQEIGVGEAHWVQRAGTGAGFFYVLAG